jgi:deoxyribodipyrimidine photo-lyase
LSDNPAVHLAYLSKKPIVFVYIWAPEEDGVWAPGAASRWWLHHSLQSLDLSLRKLGHRLIIRKGGSIKQLTQLVRETGADEVYWNRRYEPHRVLADQACLDVLLALNVNVVISNGSLLFDPAEIYTGEGKPYTVFTPFWNRASQRLHDLGELMPAPPELAAPAKFPASADLDSLDLLPHIPWDHGMRETWEPGEEGAHARLREFAGSKVQHYSTGRNEPGKSLVSMVSPHLHFGELSPAQVVDAIRRSPKGRSNGGSIYVKELGWREFAHYLLFHFPHTSEKSLRSEFDKMEWHSNKNALKAWQRGRTGFPIVDAGMRELWHTGWMHNRVRMIVASFLVKDLMQPWQEGAHWFWDTLVDADLANNTLGWQWTAGCGADAAPFFRVFNPTLQGEKFDAEGKYVRRWVPELAQMPSKWIHRPWEAPEEVLRLAGVTLGKHYPEPLVNHSVARQRALAAYAEIRRALPIRA